MSHSAWGHVAPSSLRPSQRSRAEHRCLRELRETTRTCQGATLEKLEPLLSFPSNADSLTPVRPATMLLLRARLPARSRTPAPRPTRRERQYYEGHPAKGGPVPGEERSLAAAQTCLTKLCFLREPGQRQQERIPPCHPRSCSSPGAERGQTRSSPGPGTLLFVPKDIHAAVTTICSLTELKPARAPVQLHCLELKLAQGSPTAPCTSTVPLRVRSAWRSTYTP